MIQHLRHLGAGDCGLWQQCTAMAGDDAAFHEIGHRLLCVRGDPLAVREIGEPIAVASPAPKIPMSKVKTKM